MDEIYTADEAVASGEDAKSEIADDVVGTDVTDEAPEEDVQSDEIDYEALIQSDVEALRAEFPELRGIKSITDLNNPLRYAALRDLGLSAEEAYLATAKRRNQDTRAHLRSAHGKNAAASFGMMSQQELAIARDLFPDMSDSEIQRLYKRVSR